MTPTYTPLETKDPTVFNRLVRFHVEHNYYGHVVRFSTVGKKPKPQEAEDHGQVAALIVKAQNASAWSTIHHIESRPAMQDHYSDGKLEDRLIKYSTHYDGAIVFDENQVYPYIKFSGPDHQARKFFNRLYGHDVQFYSDIQKKTLPSTFSKMEGGGPPQTGTRTTTWETVAYTLNDVETFLVKQTAYGKTGTGKVLWLYADRVRKRSVMTEFFLLHATDLPLLADRPNGSPTEDHMFNPRDGVVGIVRRYVVSGSPVVRKPLEAVLTSLATGEHLSEDYHTKLENTIRDFDPDLLRRTDARTIINRSSLKTDLKHSLSHLVCGSPLKSKIRNSAGRILRKNRHFLSEYDQRFRKTLERFLKGVEIKPVLLQSRYCSPNEFGIDFELFKKVTESEQKGTEMEYAHS